MASISFFVTGIPGDEEKRAGMALQYPLLLASAIQIRSLFYFQQKIYITNTASYLDNSGFRGYNSI